MSAMESASGGRVAAWIFVVTGVIATLLVAPVGLRLLDEGYILYNSWRFAAGDTPYVDFFVLYPPAMFLMIAGPIKAMGIEAAALAGRASVVLAAGAASWLVYALVRRVADKTTALVCAGVSLCWGVPVYNTPFPNWYCLPLLLGSALVLARRAEGRRYAVTTVWAGVLIGLAATVKQSIGVLGLVTLAVSLTLLSEPGERLRRVGLFALGWAGPVALTWAWLWRIGAAKAAFEAIVVFPLRHRGEIIVTERPVLSVAAGFVLGAVLLWVVLRLWPVGARWVTGLRPRTWAAFGVFSLVFMGLLWAIHPPTGTLDEVLSGGAWGVAAYGWMVVLAAAVTVALREGDENTRAVALSLAGVVLTLFLEAGGAWDWSHLFYIVHPALVLAALLVGDAGHPRALPLGIAGLLAVGSLAGMWTSVGPVVVGERATLGGGYTGIVVHAELSKELSDVSERLRRAPADKPVQVYPVDAGLYVLAERWTPTRHSQYLHALTPGELDEETERVRSSPPQVVVVRRLTPDVAGVGYAQWVSIGLPVLEEALTGKQETLRTEHFTVHEGQP